MRVLLLVLSSLLLAAIAFAAKPAQGTAEPGASITLPARWEYSAKFVCGVRNSPTTGPPSEPPGESGELRHRH